MVCCHEKERKMLTNSRREVLKIPFIQIANSIFPLCRRGRDNHNKPDHSLSPDSSFDFQICERKSKSTPAIPTGQTLGWAGRQRGATFMGSCGVGRGGRGAMVLGIRSSARPYSSTCAHGLQHRRIFIIYTDILAYISA